MDQVRHDGVRERTLRLIGWVAAANAIAMAFALMPGADTAGAVGDGLRAAIAWCGIG